MIWHPRQTLHPMATITIQLGDQIPVGEGPKGSRVVIDVVSAEVVGDKIRASLATNDAADWLTLSEDGKLGALDVRLTLKTEDGAFIYVEYQGRANMETGVIATAPTFQTSDEKLPLVELGAGGRRGPAWRKRPAGLLAI